MIWSYFVRGRFSCSNESNAPCETMSAALESRQGYTHPLAVDRHPLVGGESLLLRLQLLDRAHALHVRRVAPGTKNDADARARLDVLAGDERARRVVDHALQHDRDLVLLERIAEKLRAVVALGVRDAKALRPADELGVVDALLVAGIRELG